MRSLTGRLFNSVLAGALSVLAAAGTVLYFSVRQQMVAQLDRSLAEQAEMFSASVEYKPYGLEADLEQMRIQDMEESDSPAFLLIRTPEGRVLYLSSALEGISPARTLQATDEDLYGWQVMADGQRSRWIRHAFVPDYDDEEQGFSGSDSGTVVDTGSVHGGTVILELYRDAAQVDSFIRSFLLMLLLTGAGATVVLSLAIWLTIRKGAKPVGDLAARIEAISDDDLTVRIDPKMVFPELAPVVVRLNRLLDRLEASFSRERAFTSDVAHELRTPLAGLKSTLEVTLARDREGQDYRLAMGRTLGIVGHMERLVASLLLLARMESGQETLALETLDLDDMVSKVWLDHAGLAASRGVKSAMNPSGAMAAADPDLLRKVLGEIIGNAVYYVDEGGRIQIRTRDAGVDAEVGVVNSGSLLTPEDAQRVFDRFWRGSRSRTETGEKFGLGLSIASRMAAAMGGRLQVKSEKGGDFEVLLVLPGGHLTPRD